MELPKLALLNATLWVSLSATPAIADHHSLEINPNDFDENSHVISNPWWPLSPGERMVYEGQVVEEGEVINHRFVDTVTDLIKIIGGIKVLVSLEEDFRDGALIEQEIAFHAQDKYGNVWHLGQLREVYDEVEFVGGRVWFVDAPIGAKAGIRMEADPQIDGESYSQGYAPPPFNWTDRAKVVEKIREITVPAGTYNEVIVVEENDAETPAGAFQTKYYAKDIGLIQIGYKGPDPSKEELFLTAVDQLSGHELNRARNTALEIDARGYMYTKTTPAERISD